MPKQKSLKNFFGRAVTEAKRVGALWSSSRAGTFGASVAYYTIFSIAPILVIAISITGLFFDKASTEANIVAQFSSTFGHDSGEFISSLIDAKVSDSTNILLTISGFLVLLVGATGIFSQLQQALDTIFESMPGKRENTIWFKVRQKLLSFGLVLSIGFLLLTSLALSAWIQSFGQLFEGYIPDGKFFIQLLEFFLSFVIISFFLGLMYKVLPSKRLPWRPALLGGLVSGLLFTISKFLLGLYLGSSSAMTGYGGASALVLFVLWIYYMSQVFFFGAVLLRLYIAPKKS